MEEYVRPELGEGGGGPARDRAGGSHAVASLCRIPAGLGFALAAAAQGFRAMGRVEEEEGAGAVVGG